MGDLLSAVRASLDAALPATIATVSADGIPNISYMCKVMYVDENRVALSNQFFRKTRTNLEANPRALVMVVDPKDCKQYQLTLEFEESQSEGPVFDKLKADLEIIASMCGMGDVFKLASAYIFRVSHCEHLPMPPGGTSSP